MKITEPNVANAVVANGTHFGTAALVFYVYAVLGLILLHFLRPDYAPASHMISEYAIGPYGWVMRTVFIALSCASMMLFVGLLLRGPNSFLSRLGATLLGIASIGLLVSAIYSMDAPGAPSTSSGDIHDISFFVNVGSAFVTSVLLSASFGRDIRWRSYQRTSIVLTALLVVAFVLQFLTLHKGMPFGLANRFFVVVALSWSITVSYRLRTLGRRQETIS